MRAIGVVGWKNSGKTTLLCALIAALSRRGFEVASLKRAHGRADLDQPGRDSWRHREAGARQVAIATPARCAWLREGPTPADPRGLARKLDPADFLLIEGFKRSDHPKIEARLRPDEQPWLWRTDPNVVALALGPEVEPPGGAPPIFAIDDVEGLTALALERARPLVEGAPGGDCFELDEGMVTVDEAHARLARAAAAWREERSLGSEDVALERADGRILARALLAGRDIPAADNAAVDGWAFAWSSELERGASLKRAKERAAPGAAPREGIAAGEAVRILTGAPIPAGCDSVALDEQCAASDDRVELPPIRKRGSNVRPRGEDARADTVLLDAGRILRAQDVAMAALAGNDRVACVRRLRIAILSTGDELAQPGEAASPEQVYDANRPMLRALFARPALEVTDLGAIADDGAAIGEALESAGRDHDLVVSSGGASRGDEDHAAREIERRGALDFWRVALKPGRPLAFGRIGGALYLGLPGNPVAAQLCASLFALPLLAAMAGGHYARRIGPEATLRFDRAKLRGRAEYVRVRLTENGAELVARQGSGVLGSLVEATGVVELDADRGAVRAGERARYLDFSRLGALS